MLAWTASVAGGWCSGSGSVRRAPNSTSWQHLSRTGGPAPTMRSRRCGRRGAPPGRITTVRSTGSVRCRSSHVAYNRGYPSGWVVGRHGHFGAHFSSATAGCRSPWAATRSRRCSTVDAAPGLRGGVGQSPARSDRGSGAVCPQAGGPTRVWSDHGDLLGDRHLRRALLRTARGTSGPGRRPRELTVRFAVDQNSMRTPCPNAGGPDRPGTGCREVGPAHRGCPSGPSRCHPR